MSGPKVAEQRGMKGDQCMGFTGLFAPGDLEDIHLEETRVG